MDFQSPEDIDAEKAIKRTAKSSTTKSAQRSLAYTQSQQPSRSTIKSYFQPISKINDDSQSINDMINGTTSIAKLDSELMDAEKEIDMLLSPGKYSENDEHLDNNNGIDSDEYEIAVDTTPIRKSAYLSEKSLKRSVYNDSKNTLNRTQRKDKGKSRYTAYMLWSKEIRQEMFKSNPDMDFSQASRRLSQMWANVPNNEKHIWRRRAKRVTLKNKKGLKTGDKLSTTKYLNKTGRKKPGRKPKNLNNTSHSKSNDLSYKKSKSDRRFNGSNKIDDIVKHKNYTNHSNHSHTITNRSHNISTSDNSKSSSLTPGTNSMDVAAHLKLLGDNLTIIGQRLKEHEVC